MEETQTPIRENIFIAETNFALNEALVNKVFVPDGFGKMCPVPVFFRDRDSKIISDTTPTALITIGFDGYDKADGVFWNQCCFSEVIAEDAQGFPLKYRLSSGPDPVLMKYTVTARSQHWDDMISIETTLAQLFPVTDRLFDIKGFKTHLYRAGYSAADSEELGIFIRNFSLEIIGYIFPENCNAEVVPAIKSVIIEMVPNSDPDSDPVETVELDC